MSAKQDKRNRAIVAMIEAGVTLEATGAVFGLSRQRAFSIYEAYTKEQTTNTNNDDARTI